MYFDSNSYDDEMAYDYTQRTTGGPTRERAALNERLSTSSSQKRNSQARYSRRSKGAQLFNGVHRRGSKKGPSV